MTAPVPETAVMSLKQQRAAIKMVIDLIRGQQEKPKDPYQKFYFAIFERAMHDLTNPNLKERVDAKFYLNGDLDHLTKIGIDTVWAKETLVAKQVPMEWTLDDTMIYIETQTKRRPISREERLESLMTRMHIWGFSIPLLPENERLEAEGIVHALRSQIRGIMQG